MASKEANDYLKNLMSDKNISSSMNPCIEVIRAFDAGKDSALETIKCMEGNYFILTVPKTISIAQAYEMSKNIADITGKVIIPMRENCNIIAADTKDEVINAVKEMLNGK